MSRRFADSKAGDQGFLQGQVRSGNPCVHISAETDAESGTEDGSGSAEDCPDRPEGEAERGRHGGDGHGPESPSESPSTEEE